MGAVAYLQDRLFNLVSMLGTEKDKASADQYGFEQLGQEQLESAYRGDWIARKVIDVPPFDMVRAWRDWQAEDDVIEVVEAAEKRFCVREKVRKALVKARLYGGSALVLGVAQGTPEQELDVERVAKGQLLFVHVVPAHDLTTGEILRDVLSPYYEQPSYYEVRSANGMTARVHPSRVIRFLGNELPDLLREPNTWGDSVLQAVDDAIKNAGRASGGIASLLHEAKIDVISIPNLMQNLSTTGYTQQLSTRFGLANRLKSVNNMLLLDKDETWDRKEMSFMHLPEILQIYLQIAAGAADIPATRLLGQAPVGMNATGESDIRNYYDRISSEQNIMLGPQLERLDQVMVRSEHGTYPDDLYYEWAPLWQLDEVQQAAVYKNKAETSQIYISSGLVPADALARSVCTQLVEDGVYPGLEAELAAAKQEAGEAVLGAEAAAAEEARLAAEAAAAGTDPNDPPGTRTGDAAPRTLYVRRDVLNAAEIRAWARSQGFNTVVEDLHVTVAFSRTPVDWMRIGSEAWGEAEMTVEEGGPRLVEALGNKGAVVLLFGSSRLSWRHEDIKRAGASWDFDGFQPHVTITYDAGDLDLSTVKAYQGKIRLGPEIFEEIDDDVEVKEK